MTEARLEQLAEALLDAMRRRSAVKFTFGFEAGHQVTAADLAAIEASVGSGLAGFMRLAAEACGKPIPEIPERLFFLDVATLSHEDDGENEVRVEVDFGWILGAHRGPMLATGKAGS